jgi:hypothetical protein
MSILKLYESIDVFFKKLILPTELCIPKECIEISKTSVYSEWDIYDLAKRLNYDYKKVRDVIKISQEYHIDMYTVARFMEKEGA